ncbi:MAG: hypothetical protein JXL97_05705 [Bacteroidales bacterium]|nr:hypothetical protein [Bacteroidales bacterium]
MKRILYLLIFLPSIIFAQSQNPPSVKWKQVETPHFRVIFPEEIEEYALETAYLMDTIYNKDTKIFRKNYPKKVDLYLYNRSVVSNAYAALGPRRMVWYLTPPSSPSLTLSAWNKTLGIHEYRHITQYSVMNEGFTQLASVVAGEYGQSLMENWSTPNWFYEGDAIYNETKYSNSGRGRMPSFSLPQRTILLNDQKFSYEKALFRSYKDYYPNHYYLGYHIVARTNTKYGEQIWNQILDRSSYFSFWPYTFERSMKKYTGQNVRKTYKSTYSELDSTWTEEISNLETTEAEILNQKKKRVWTNYFEPQIINKDTLLVLKSGYDNNTTMYYLFSNGEEKKIREISGENISYSNGKVTWARYSEHPRYGEESYSDIVIYDLKTKKLDQITKKGKYFSPELSPDGKKIVAIEFGQNLIGKIVIFDLQGNILNTFEIDKEFYPMLPIWTDDGKSIIYLQTSTDGESMIKFNIEKATTETLIEPQWLKFDKPYCKDGYVFFNYDYSGITNIYALNIETKNIFQVTSRKFAANQTVVSPENKKIYFTDYNLNGFDIAKMEYKPENWKKLENINEKVFEYFKSPITENQIKNINTDFTKNIPETYKSEKFKASKKFINIHSWSPFLDGNLSGIEVYSDNTMNTMSVTGSVYGNFYSNILMSSVWLQYKKYFPIMSVGFSTGQNGEVFDYDLKTDSVENWYHNSVNFSTSVPLNFSRGIYYRALNLNAGGSFISMSNFNGDFYEELGLKFTQLASYSTSFSFTNRRFMNYRDLLPKFGQSITLGYRKVPNLFDIHGEHLYFLSTFYFPGIMKHHGIKINLDYENKSRATQNTYSFSSATTMPRGYTQVYYNRIVKTSAEYQLPLFYPDFNIPYLLFVKRVRANIFYDYAQLTQNANTSIRSSAGAEVLFDFNILRMNFFTIDAGIQIAYLIEEQKWVSTPLLLGAKLTF